MNAGGPRVATADGGVDLTMMYAIHDALRRDVARLLAAADDTTFPAEVLRRRWATTADQLHHHHTGEDLGIWPLLRPHLDGDPTARRQLDGMRAQHGEIDAAVAMVGQALAADPPNGSPALRRFAGLVERHLADEERDALPLISRFITAAQWKAFENGQKRALGLAGAARFFPWVLDDASPSQRSAVLALLPGPLRLLLRARWEPRYRRSLTSGL